MHEIKAPPLTEPDIEKQASDLTSPTSFNIVLAGDGRSLQRKNTRLTMFYGTDRRKNLTTAIIFKNAFWSELQLHTSNERLLSTLKGKNLLQEEQILSFNS